MRNSVAESTPNRFILSRAFFVLLATILFQVALTVRAATPTLTPQDVGFPSLAGSTTVAGDKITVVGGGNDIWNTSDNFHFAYFPVNGDFDYIVKVESLEGPDTWTKAGLMARAAADDGAGNLFPDGTDPFIMNLTTRSAGQNEVRTQFRNLRAGSPGEIIPSPVRRPTYPNTWLRLRREGNTFTSFASEDGTNWVRLGTHTVSPDEFPARLALGLAVTAHNDADPNGATAVFSNFAEHVPVAVAITTQPPATVSAMESTEFEISVAASGDPVSYQWQKDGTDIPGATGATLTIPVVKPSDAGTYTVRVYNSLNSVTSTGTVLTVPPDTIPPTIVSAEAGTDRISLTLEFSELIDPATAGTVANYSVSPSLTLSDPQVTDNTVRFTTTEQTVGTEYTITINNVADVAGNPIAAASQVKFRGIGPLLQDDSGFVVWEAEDYDTLIFDEVDGPLWTINTSHGTPSGGASMQMPDNVGDGQFTDQLEYKIMFTKTGTHYFWARAYGIDGGADSVWLHLDGAVPAERDPANGAPANSAALSGFNNGAAGDFTWENDSFGGPDPMTFVIETPGLHTIGIGSREDGAFVDKFVITTTPGFNPGTGFGPTGPAVTQREGEPPPAGTSLEITSQPVSVDVVEGAPITLTAATATSQGLLVGYQWQRKEGNNFVDIPGATTLTYSVSRAPLSLNGTTVRLRASGGGITRVSDEATITVRPDTVAPQLVRASGSGTRLLLEFSEPLAESATANLGNFTVQGPGGALAVSAAALGTVGNNILLETAAQTPGTKYTVTAGNISDTAATANVLASGQARFYSQGDLKTQNDEGLIVFEAENFDAIQGEFWELDTLRGTPSGGASMRNTGGSESDKLEYNINFTKTGTHYIWLRGLAAGGGDDSVWLHLDGARPPERDPAVTTGVNANSAGLTGFGSRTDFGWANDSQGGPDPMTFVVPTAGPHVIGIARRETGALVDKIVITTNAAFNPNNFGTFGPSGAVPPLATAAITAPATGEQLAAGSNVALAVNVADNGRVIERVEFFNRTEKLGESTTSPFGFTLTNAATGTYLLTARVTDDTGQTGVSSMVPFIVGDPKEALLIVGNTNLTAALGDAGVRDRLTALGYTVFVVDDAASVAADAFGKKLVVNSSSVDSGSVNTKFRDVAVPVVTWEQANQDDFGMTGNTDGTDRGTVAAQTQIEVLATAHPLAAGLAAGPLTFVTGPADVSWGLPAEGATRIATVVGNADRVAIYGYDAGATMANGSTAPARRVHLFLSDTAYTLLTADGHKLFDAAISWATGAATGGIQLTARRDAGGLRLEWSGGTPPYTIQRKNSLSDANWQDVMTSGNTSETIPTTGAAGFFRIQDP